MRDRLVRVALAATVALTASAHAAKTAHAEEESASGMWTKDVAYIFKNASGQDVKVERFDPGSSAKVDGPKIEVKCTSFRGDEGAATGAEASGTIVQPFVWSGTSGSLPERFFKVDFEAKASGSATPWTGEFSGALPSNPRETPGPASAESAASGRDVSNNEQKGYGSIDNRNQVTQTYNSPGTKWTFYADARGSDNHIYSGVSVQFTLSAKTIAGIWVAPPGTVGGGVDGEGGGTPVGTPSGGWLGKSCRSEAKAQITVANPRPHNPNIP